MRRHDSPGSPRLSQPYRDNDRDENRFSPASATTVKGWASALYRCEPRPDESFREAAERELAEEAGVDADYDGLAMSVRVDIECDEYATWGVLPLFEARAEATALTVADPDGEIADAGWFDDLPEDTRDREDLLAWRERALE